MFISQVVCTFTLKLFKFPLQASAQYLPASEVELEVASFKTVYSNILVYALLRYAVHILYSPDLLNAYVVFLNILELSFTAGFNWLAINYCIIYYKGFTTCGCSCRVRFNGQTALNV